MICVVGVFGKIQQFANQKEDNQELQGGSFAKVRRHQGHIFTWLLYTRLLLPVNLATLIATSEKRIIMLGVQHPLGGRWIGGWVPRYAEATAFMSLRLHQANIPKTPAEVNYTDTVSRPRGLRVAGGWRMVGVFV